MNNAKHGHGIAVVAIDGEIGINDTDANALSEVRTRRSDVGVIAQEPKEVVKQSAVFVGHFASCLGGKLIKNLVGVVKRGWRQDEPRHQGLRRAKRASM
jgi:hypothetical protein